MKKHVAIVLIILIIVAIIFFVISKNTNSGGEVENSSLPISYIENNEEDKNTVANDENQVQENSTTEVSQFVEEENSTENQNEIEEITKTQGLQGDAGFYELITEYDGRQTVAIKPWIQFQVALIGAIKKSKPEFSEMNDLLKKAPIHTGIWITEGSRTRFLEILNSISKDDYKISDDGFLIQNVKSFENDLDKKVRDLLKSEKLYVFDINSVSYLVDEVTGDIQEYPFEEMDPLCGYELFETDNKQIFIVSANNLR